MNPDCPHCQGTSPSSDGKTECGWCSPDHVPSIIPTDGAKITPKMLDSKADLQALIDGSEMFRRATP